MLFHLTQHCSLQCPHCFIESTPNDRHAAPETVKRFVDFAKQSGATRIGIAGGEPTEHPEFTHHFLYILKKLSRKKMVVLMTNGRFLLNEDLTITLAKLQKKFQFLIQVSALKGIYPKRKETKEYYHKHANRFNDIHLVECITSMVNLGRAVGKDWSHLGNLYKHLAPMCFNIFSVFKSGEFGNFRDALKWVELNTSNFCKPLISWDGSFHAGETSLCLELGNIMVDDMDTIFRNVKEEEPCGLCGIPLPISLG